MPLPSLAGLTALFFPADASLCSAHRSPECVLQKYSGRPPSPACVSVAKPSARAQSGWKLAKHFRIAHCVHAPSWPHSPHVRLIRAAFTNDMSIVGASPGRRAGVPGTWSGRGFPASSTVAAL